MNITFFYLQRQLKTLFEFDIVLFYVKKQDVQLLRVWQEAASDLCASRGCHLDGRFHLRRLPEAEEHQEEGEQVHSKE